MRACPECGSKKIETNNSGQYCKNCGLVLSDALFSGAKAIA